MTSPLLLGLRNTRFATRHVPLSAARPPMSLSVSRAATAAILQQRHVATSVSTRPASQSIPQAALNWKEESSNAASDIAKAIAGTAGADAGDKHGFVDITKTVASEVPRPAMVLGLAGSLPYLGAGATTVYLARQAGLAASGLSTSNIDPGVALTILDQALTVQVTYGAVMLSFLGALHWGFEFAGYGGYKGYRRLLLGAAPLAFAWPTLTLQPMTALVIQWLGFTSLWAADAKVTGMGWTPKWFAQYRFYLSVLIGTCILGSLAGTSYYGPVAGHGFISHDLDLVKAEREKLKHDKPKMVNGPIEAVVEEEDGGFVKIQKNPKLKKEE